MHKQLLAPDWGEHTASGYKEAFCRSTRKKENEANKFEFTIFLNRLLTNLFERSARSWERQTNGVCRLVHRLVHRLVRNLLAPRFGRLIVHIQLNGSLKVQDSSTILRHPSLACVRIFILRVLPVSTPLQQPNEVLFEILEIYVHSKSFFFTANFSLRSFRCSIERRFSERST